MGKVGRCAQGMGEDPDLLDLSGCTVMPGLIDSHVHLFISGTTDRQAREGQLVAGFTGVSQTITRHLSQHLSCGVVAVRDGGDSRALVLRFKTTHLNPSQSPVGVTVKAAGSAWHCRGRYGRMIGRSPEDAKTLAQAISDNRGDIDHVKIVNSGLNSLVRFGRQTPPQFDFEEMTDAVDAAKGRGLSVMVHANGEAPVAIAVKAGCTSVEHGFFMGRENLMRMAENQVVWVPTACTMQALALHNSAVAARNLDHQLEQLRMARDLGVPVALGTDAGSLGVHHGRAVGKELGLLVAAGYPVHEAIRCASSNGAGLLGIADLGRLKSGGCATFIAVRGNPAMLPDSLNHIQHICIEGKFMDEIRPAFS